MISIRIRFSPLFSVMTLDKTGSSEPSRADPFHKYETKERKKAERTRDQSSASEMDKFQLRIPFILIGFSAIPPL